MRNSISKACVGLAFLCMTPATGFAEEKSYVCAINEVYECVTVTGCSRVSLEDANVAGDHGARYRKEAASLGSPWRRTSRG
jgi:hypothetical protein